MRWIKFDTNALMQWDHFLPSLFLFCYQCRAPSTWKTPVLLIQQLIWRRLYFLQSSLAVSKITQGCQQAKKKMLWISLKLWLTVHFLQSRGSVDKRSLKKNEISHFRQILLVLWASVCCWISSVALARRVIVLFLYSGPQLERSPAVSQLPCGLFLSHISCFKF